MPSPGSAARAAPAGRSRRRRAPCTNGGRPSTRAVRPERLRHREVVGRAAVRVAGTRWPSSGSLSSDRPSKRVPASQAPCTNSNWRAMLALRQMKCRPRRRSPCRCGRSPAPARATAAARSRGRAAAADGSASRRPGRCARAPASKPSMRTSARHRAGGARRQVGVARIAAPDVGAERAAQAVRGRRDSRSDCCGVVDRRRSLRADAADQRLALQRAADHRLGQLPRAAPRRRRPAGRGSARSRARPAAAGAAPGSCRCGRGRPCPARPRRAAAAPPPGRAPGRAAGGRCSRRIRSDSRAGIRPGRRRWCSAGWSWSRSGAPALPVELRLRDAVDEAEGLGRRPGRLVGAPLHLEAAPRTAPGRCLRTRVQLARHAHRAAAARAATSLAAAPVPARRRAGAEVAQPARAAGVAAHAGDELGREASTMSSATPSARSPALRQRHLQRGRAAAGRAKTALVDRRLRQPGPRGAPVAHPQQQEAGLRQVAEAEAHQALDVVVARRRVPWRRAHSSLSHSRVCASLMSARSRPSRMRAVALQVDQRQAGVGLVPDLRRQLVPALVVLEALLVPRAARRPASRCAASRSRC